MARAGDFASQQKRRLQERTEAKEKATRLSGELAELLATEAGQRATRTKKETEMTLNRQMQEGSGPKLEPGTYAVTCKSVRADMIENSQYDPNVIRFELEVDDMVDDEGDPITLDPIARDLLTPMSKLTEWLMAFGITAEIGQNVNIEDCVGKKAQAVVVARKGKDGKPSPFVQVTSIIPASKMRVMDGDDSLSGFWAQVRNKGWTTKDLREFAVEGYGKEPKDMTAEERRGLLAAI